ncbi:glycoside hydrolase family 32 protein, partial [Sinomonas sp. JGH33]
RDPKVFRYDSPTGPYWVMVAVEATERKVVLYRSEDLMRWTYLSEFTSAEPVGRIWECPDLFPLPVDGDPENVKWVLIVNLDRETGEGGSAGIFFIGDFDGVAFTPAGGPPSAAADQPEWEWLDHGRDCYATVSFNNTPDDRRILVGWMSNWDYARAVPTSPWRGAMALPREATLHRRGPRVVLRQRAVPGLAPGEPAQALGARDLPEGSLGLGPSGGLEPYLIEAIFDSGTSAEFGLLIREGVDQATRIAYTMERGELVVDRTSAGKGCFSPSFPSTETVAIELVGGRLSLSIYVDASSVEVFAQDGLATITEQIFPSPASTGISAYSVGGTAQLVSLRFTPLASAAVTRLPSDPVPGGTGALGRQSSSAVAD